MIVNLNLTLCNKTKIRMWVDITNIEETKLLRFFKALTASDNLNEQFAIIEKINAHRGYNEASEVTMLYDMGKNKVTLCKSNFNNGKFHRGQVIRYISI